MRDISIFVLLKYFVTLTRLRLFTGERVTRFSTTGGGDRFLGGERLTAAITKLS